ncbi:unnamed protein product [Ilex paraguariensis]|uniref:Protein SIEVE ELEMENT OCCLUSION B-like n=1 Tax=Ilex paraguariensis TaxID=185542 RepID=A0ABC8UHK0_9AQUA
MATVVVPPRMQPTRLGRGDRNVFTMSDDTPAMKQILETHAPDGRDSGFDVKPLFQIVEDIIHHSTSTVPWITHVTREHLGGLEDRATQNGFNEMLQLLAHPISTVSCEISCKCSGGSDGHSTTKSICVTLSGYSWDAKVVIALAAFAVIYGEFWLVAQLYLSSPLAKSVAYLKQLPETLERVDLLKPKLESLIKLIGAMLDVTTCILRFKELPLQYITSNTPAMATANAHIPAAVYWTMRSIVACASQIMNVISMGPEYISLSTEVSWELSTLEHKLKNILELLQNQLDLCNKHIGETRSEETYQTIVRVMSTSHIDNQKVLKILIYGNDDQPPLHYGTEKRLVGVEELRKKVVLLFISDLDLNLDEELWLLQSIYEEKIAQPSHPESQYEIVWLPIVEFDRTKPLDEEKVHQFHSLKSTMKWYTITHPSLIDPAVIRYTKEVWRFTKKPLLVALDQQGKMVNQNAIHMIYIWGSLAYPFTSSKEAALWEGVGSWNFSVLADNIDRALLDWITQDKFICMYGGEDIMWIRKFIEAARIVAQAANIHLELIYVGKNNLKEKVRKNNVMIVDEKLGAVIELGFVSFFWARLNSMWQSKLQLKAGDSENDPIVQEIKTILSYDSGEQGWAVISRGTVEMTRAKGDIFLQAMLEYNNWITEVAELGFVHTIDKYLRDKLHPKHHCTRLILPLLTGDIPERVVCAECRRPMEKFVMYRCCVDAATTEY